MAGGICSNNSPAGILPHLIRESFAMHFKRLFTLSCVVAVVAPFGVLLAGCGMELETGYKYRPLSASPVQRRGYYASPYSQEKAAAEQEQKQSGPKLGGRSE